MEIVDIKLIYPESATIGVQVVSFSEHIIPSAGDSLPPEIRLRSVDFGNEGIWHWYHGFIPENTVFIEW